MARQTASEILVDALVIGEYRHHKQCSDFPSLNLIIFTLILSTSYHSHHLNTAVHCMSQTKVALRSAQKLVPVAIPDNFLFLESPAPRRCYIISFRHPAYPNNNNELLSLNAYDQPGGGIHYGFAHTICAIIANNRFDGFLSTNQDGSGRVEARWDSCLPYNVHGYYFHVPSPGNHDGTPSDPYRWPLVPSFLDWKYPHDHLPKYWSDCNDGFFSSSIGAQSDQTGAVRARDVVCRVSAHQTGVEVAHLIPAAESAWFETNRMARYNPNRILDADNLLRDPANALLLRSDLHKAFDERQFVYFPKDDKGFVVHVLQSATDLRLLYHNARVDITGCEVNFVFARLAWSIFPLLAQFLVSSSKPRLVIQWDQLNETWIEREVNCEVLRPRVVASRSNSPTKRARLASSTASSNHEDDFPENTTSDHYNALHTPPDGSFELPHGCKFESRRGKRTLDEKELTGIDAYVAKSRRLSTFSITPGKFHSDIKRGKEGSCITDSPSFRDGNKSENNYQGCDILDSRDTCDTASVDTEEEWRRHDRLRNDALLKQRPKNYYLPPYDRQRSAKEELEFMGVEIIDTGEDD
ncbi:hypothetical protein F5884DRAFT_808886 [Xylogone sp. PMI_703]|nr:hypothetical protein F5884DRAFT_808886 [Xylogone sp. PMI_703]